MDTEQIINLKNQALALILDTESQTELELLRQKYLGRKGEINKLLKKFSQEPKENRALLGQTLNDAKKAISQTLISKSIKEKKVSDWLDVTQPGIMPAIGRLHPISQAIHEISNIFKSIGFTRVRYPEVDWDWYVFESLNMPKDHPARDEWETFFIDQKPNKQNGQLVLTPHTSNSQAREMERVKKPPIRMLNIAKCYRRQQDVTHTAMFHQFECLVIDQGINIQHLKGTIEYFAKKYYQKDIKIRLRPFNFSFTEPSFEVDFSCTICDGTSVLKNKTKCRVCKSGWLEVAGTGMVHPNVLKAGGIDPEKYTGFAFGMGVERAFTLKLGLQLDDIRPLYNNNLEFLKQF